MKKIIYLCVCLAFTLSQISCSTEDENHEPTEEELRAEAAAKGQTFIINVIIHPNGSDEYIGGEIHYNRGEDSYVVSFDEGYYWFRTNIGKRFEVTKISSPGYYSWVGSRSFYPYESINENCEFYLEKK